jgi:hypothetical protein
VNHVAFSKTSEPLRFDKKLGLCFGWFCFSKQAGVEYDDEHGDHFPDDELVIAVDALMAKAGSEREINIEHAGAGRGSIATAVAMTEDVAKAYGIDTHGTYGVLGSFRPDAALLKSIEAGERFCLSIEGHASNVETIAKSADGVEIAAAKRKRIMRGVELTKLAVVKAGAHRGAAVALIKTAPDGAPPDTETKTMDEIAKAQAETATVRAELAKASARASTLASLLTALASLPVEQVAYAKSLSGDALETFLAKSDADRAVIAKPVHVSKSTGEVYFASDDPRIVRMAKAADETAVELAKAREAVEAADFAKAADVEIPFLKGKSDERAELMRFVKSLPEERGKALLEILKSANYALENLTKRVGHGGGNGPDAGGAEAELEKLAKSVHEKNPTWSFAKAYDAALDTPQGRVLYGQLQTPRA